MLQGDRNDFSFFGFESFFRLLLLTKCGIYESMFVWTDSGNQKTEDFLGKEIFGEFHSFAVLQWVEGCALSQAYRLVLTKRFNLHFKNKSRSAWGEA